MRQIGTEEISSLSKLVKLTVAEVSRDFLTLILNPFPGDFQNALGPGPRGRAASTPYTARINLNIEPITTSIGNLNHSKYDA